MAAIALQIAIENMPVAHYALRIIGDIVSYTQARKMGSFENHDDLLLRIRQRLINMPNAEYLKLWLQSLTNKLDKANNTPSPSTLPCAAWLPANKPNCGITVGSSPHSPAVCLYNLSLTRMPYLRRVK